MSDSRQKTVVVLGGAGLLGKTLSFALASNGWFVVVADLNLGRALEVATEISLRFGRPVAIGVLFDITDSISIRQVVRRGEEEFGKVDAMVNVAYPRNSTYGSKLEDVTYASFCENVSLHMGGYFLAAKEFALYFRDHGGGSIVNFSSVYGVIAPRFEIYKGTSMTMPVEYAAIKAGVQHMSKYMAKYFKGSHVRINCLSPGGILDGQPEAFLSRYSENAMTKGMLVPDDIVGGVLFLLSEAALFVNGQNLIIDDGWTL